MSMKDALALTPETLNQVIANPEVSDEERERLVDELELARSFGKYQDISDLMEEISELGNAFGVEVVRDEDLNDRYWGDIRGQYINMGDQYAATLIYDQVDNEFLVTDWEAYVLYLESQKTPIWRIPVTQWDETESYWTVSVWIEADTLEEALERLVDEIDSGNEEIWVNDDRFDLGSVERAEGPATDVRHQMWYISGMDDADYTEEELDSGLGSITVALKVFPDEAEQVTKEDVRDQERFFAAE